MKWTPMQPLQVGDIVQSGRSGAVLGEVIRVETHSTDSKGRERRYALPMITVRIEAGHEIRKPLSRWHLQRRPR